MTDGARDVGVIHPIRDRSPRRTFGAEPPSETELASLFRAAALAPSAGNAQPWRFVLCRVGMASHDALAGALRGSNRWASAAPVLVVTAVQTHHLHPTKPPKENRLALFELGLATGNLLAQATALGLVARPLGGFDREAVRSTLAIPDAWELGVLVAIGLPAATDSPEPMGDDAIDDARERLDLREFVFEGRWGRELESSSTAIAEPSPGEPGGDR